MAENDHTDIAASPAKGIARASLRDALDGARGAQHVDSLRSSTSAPRESIESGAIADPLQAFLDWVAGSGLSLYPAQEEAILALCEGKNVVLATPTGSGKSLVAAALHFLACASGRKSVYTSPVKALVNEKFRALCRDFGAARVGLSTGDGSVNGEAPILCCTAEILANRALREGEKTGFADVVMDEFHFFSDRERGMAWQVPLLTMRGTRFLLMSATLGDTTVFEKGMNRLNGRETARVSHVRRPVPLEFEYREQFAHETLLDLSLRGRLPAYLVCFSQREASESAQEMLSREYCTKEEKKALADSLAGFRFDTPYGKDLSRLLRHGIGVHHAGLLPKYRAQVERLAQRGMLKVICGTDTLGVGVNIPIRTVVFTKLCKFDGEKTTLLAARDFHQIAGRAGRKGFDDVGYVIALAPEHVVENQRLESKAGGDPRRLRKIVKRKAPEFGYVHWDKSTFEKLRTASPEALRSRFQVTHGTLLNVLSRGEGGCEAMRRLIRESYEPDERKRYHRKAAFAAFRSLVDRGIVHLGPSGLSLGVDLQEDFSLDHALALFVFDTIPLLDSAAPSYALDVLTLVESILENPEAILRRQLDRLKRERLRELKSAGVEFEERMEELDKLEHPKPNRDFIYSSFNEFARKHPWVGEDNIRPKSVAREIVEGFFEFNDYVKEYGLERSEGLLLRYLSETYRVLLRTVPDLSKNDDLYAIGDFLGKMIRETDSSLLDEWERLAGIAGAAREAGASATVPVRAGVASGPGAPAGSPLPGVTRREFSIQVRNEVFRAVRALASRDYPRVLAHFLPGDWDAATLERAMAPYYGERSRIRTDTHARANQNCRIGDDWSIEQVLCDAEGHDDWVLRAQVDLAESARLGRPALILRGIGDLSRRV